jgi:hypothetical protein
MTIREGVWDCQHCGARGLPSREQACPGCGAVRPPNVRFRLPDSASEITTPDLLARAAEGPDWGCDQCGTSNSGRQTSCQQCGAPRESLKHPPAPQPFNAESPLTSARRSHPVRHLVGGGIAAVLLLAIFFSWLFASQTETLQVQRTQWMREHHIEQISTITEEDWSVPSGGRERSRFRAVHHYDKVLDHYETRTRQVQTGTRQVKTGTRDLGNGFFEDVYESEPIYGTETYEEPIYRDEPRYATKYRYQIERWRPSRVDRAEGVRGPQWPNTNLATGVPPYNVGAERVGNTKEIYTVTLWDKQRQKSHAMDVTQADWNRYDVGGNVTAHMSRWGSIREIVFAER